MAYSEKLEQRKTLKDEYKATNQELIDLLGQSNYDAIRDNRRYMTLLSFFVSDLNDCLHSDGDFPESEHRAAAAERIGYYDRLDEVLDINNFVNIRQFILHAQEKSLALDAQNLKLMEVDFSKAMNLFNQSHRLGMRIAHLKMQMNSHSGRTPQ